MRASWRSTLMAVMLGAVFAEGVEAAEPGTQHWAENLSAGTGTSELVGTRDGLLYEPNAVMRRPEGLSRLTGLFEFPARTLEQPVDTFRPQVQASVGLGQGVEVDVRVRTPGGAWSEWRTATGDEAVRLPRSGTEVQVRLVLIADERGRGPVVQTVGLEGWRGGGAPDARAADLPRLRHP
ncbi:MULTISPECIES: hypothetical protein [Corallococcus]|uniref:hypothetical protein n=1 Tax=Corallococcus TaxID=83461 RepID=UPI001F163490|nr:MULTISPECIES: hypothetical protein [Corallococcus]